ncbi:MAG TPA: phosphoglucosamine mutase [bacterium]|nr:phosphoglucosamine mutase [bacterium]
MTKLFGTDGVRGIANIYPMTVEVAMQIGRAVAYIAKRKEYRHKILIGKDTRLSCYMLENALAAGICSMGVDVYLVGPVPTPGIAFITRDMRADAGIVISASHNPFQDNGIKIFSRKGYKLPDELEEKIEDIIFSRTIDSLRPTADDVGKAYRIEDVLGRYIVFLKKTFPDDLTLDGMKIAIDCANGATYKVAPTVFRELGAEVYPIHIYPNGTNINFNCGSQYTSDLQNLVKEKKAHIGIAFDGDGDRFIAVDENGNEISGDKIIAICANYMHKKNKLKNNAVVTTVMSNLGLTEMLNNLGIKHYKSQVGDRYVIADMLKYDVNLGGEDSGHIIFTDYHTTGDGILSALQLLSIMKETREPLSQLAKVMKTYPQKLINVEVREKKNLDEIKEISDAINKAEKELGESGRLLVRYSGTQMYCRVMVEAPTEKLADKITKNIASVIKEKLG